MFKTSVSVCQTCIRRRHYVNIRKANRIFESNKQKLGNLNSSGFSVRLFSSSRLNLATLYDKLGIPEGSPIETVKQAYFELAKKYHPDQTKDPHAHEKFLEIKQAYELLRNPDTKSTYDASMKSYGASAEELEAVLRRMREKQQSGGKDYSSSTNQAYREWAENQKKYYNIRKDYPKAKPTKNQNIFFWAMATLFMMSFFIIFMINKEKNKNRPRRRGPTPYPIYSVKIPHYFRRDLLKKQIAYQQFRYVEDYINRPENNTLPVTESTEPEIASNNNLNNSTSTQIASETPLIEPVKPNEMYIATLSHIGNAPKQFKLIKRTDENGEEITELIQTTKEVVSVATNP